MNRPTRKQIKEALNTVPIDQVLGVPGQLTHKQKTFARLVASGHTGADSYRMSYDTEAKPKTIGDNASRLKHDSRIQAEIDAYKLANEAAAYQTPAQLRALVIHSLVQTVIDPDVKAATKVAAAKVLGNVAEVGAFVTRTEHRVIKTSDDAKTELLNKLRGLMMQGATDAEVKDVDSLIREIRSDSGNNSSNEATPENVADAERDPHTPESGAKESLGSIHTMLHTQTSPKSTTPSIFPTDLESKLMETPPVIKT